MKKKEDREYEGNKQPSLRKKERERKRERKKEK